MATLYAEIERLIARSGLEWPFLRPRMFATNALFWWAPAVQTNGIVRWPYAAAETAPVHDGDVAAVAAITLRRGGPRRSRLRLDRTGCADPGDASSDEL
jgi:uncharacterized protein YbjT (DUF2867 family)